MLGSFPLISYNRAWLQTRYPTLSPWEYSGGAKVRKINRWLSTLEAFIMPGKAKKTGNKRSGFTTTFVNFKLSTQDKAAFVKWAARGVETVQQDFTQAIGRGCKMSLSENAEQGFYLASMTMRDEGSINYDYCITSRSPDWWEALIMNVFKAETLGWDESWSDQADSDDWG